MLPEYSDSRGVLPPTPMSMGLESLQLFACVTRVTLDFTYKEAVYEGKHKLLFVF